MSTKSKKKPVDVDAFKNAIADIRNNNLSVRAAAEKYGVARSTLHDKLSGKFPEGPTTRGPDPILTFDEERQITEWLIKLSKCEFPIKSDDLLNTVQKIVKDTNRQTPFKNGRPGKTWMKSFFRRNPSISQREAENITKGRAIITEEFIRKWFIINYYHSNFKYSISKSTIINSSLNKHLYYPKLINFSGKRRVKDDLKTPSAISSMAWRAIYIKKEQKKQNDVNAIQQRKLERLKKKELSIRKTKNLRKTTSKTKFQRKKEKCYECSDELISDIEDDLMKNRL